MTRPLTECEGAKAGSPGGNWLAAPAKPVACVVLAVVCSGCVTYTERAFVRTEKRSVDGTTWDCFREAQPVMVAKPGPGVLLRARLTTQVPKLTEVVKHYKVTTKRKPHAATRVLVGLANLPLAVCLFVLTGPSGLRHADAGELLGPRTVGVRDEIEHLPGKRPSGQPPQLIPVAEEPVWLSLRYAGAAAHLKPQQTGPDGRVAFDITRHVAAAFEHVGTGGLRWTLRAPRRQCTEEGEIPEARLQELYISMMK